QNYLVRIDPEEHLGLDHTSIQHLHIGDLKWTIDGPSPPMSPSSYLIGYNDSVSLTLKGVDENRLDSLSFETMISRSILERYVSLMTEFKRVIFCGPSGTGKTYLALKLAQYMSDRLAKEGRQPKMSLFNVDHKSSKELRQYLSSIAQDSTAAAAAAATAENGNSDNAFQDNVIILDNLHHVVSVADVFNGFISMGNQNSPYVIGTMNQVSSSSASTNLQLHHMFRWVLYSNHIKPVHGFLGRFLRRHLVEREVLEIDDEEELKKMIDWIPQVWQHVNRLLEMHNSSEVTLGPQLYLSCPMASQLIKLWFTDLWNYSIFPYIVEAIKEGIQTYGCRAVWEDPTDWIVRTCPWSSEASTQFLHLRPEDVGYDMTQQQHSLVTSNNNNASNNSINNNTGSAAFHNNINNNLYINNCADDGSHSAKISNTDPLVGCEDFEI
ncbi:hypothetical protein HELRODRAFT_62952, partial [Helobdella robusta]|uniref:AAA+ ATPase domain-containing protein n=1 Tax=Helobdella robusta TaxID=6412 RepID=T1FX83_HELRO